MYELTFTKNFKKGLEELPREIYPIIDRQLERISLDPYAKNPNAKAMKNAPKTFRVRIGLHVRMLYRIYDNNKRIEINGIGARKNIFDQNTDSIAPLTNDEVEKILAEIRGRIHIQQAKVSTSEILLSPSNEVELTVKTEELEWVDENVLFLLNISAEKWPAVINAGSLDRLTDEIIDDRTKELIADYLTNPSPNQSEKLYTLEKGKGVETIANQSLKNFLIALDPGQKKALKKIKTDGPYLIKGSAGTGKTLVGLYHILDLILSRSAESLFDQEQTKFGVITYTNTLADGNLSLLKSIINEKFHSYIECTTLDKVVLDLVIKKNGARIDPLNTDGICKWIDQDVKPVLSNDDVKLIDCLGCDYVANEIEDVILGNGIESIDEYLKFERKGRKRGLREAERKVVWGVYENFNALCHQRKVRTWGQRRVIALSYLREHPDHDRFTALFVDEAQDFSRVARQICLELVRDPKHMLLASDTGQSIFTVPPSWIQSHPEFDFRRRKPIMLTHSYRMSREICDAIVPLRLDLGDREDHSDCAIPVFSGYKPRWLHAPQHQHIDLVCEEIKILLDSGKNAGQIAVIVRDHDSAHRFNSNLDNWGIDSIIVEKNSPLQLDGKRVNIVTAPSSKGLGFPIVFVPEVHAATYPARWLIDKAKDSQQIDQIMEAEQRLLYVALSRAIHRLYMIVAADAPSPFVNKLNREGFWD